MVFPAHLHRLIDHYGTQTATAQAVSLSEKTISNGVNLPGYGATVSPRLRTVARSAVEDIDPFPLPAYMNLTRQSFVPLKKLAGKPELANRIIEIEGTLAELKPASTWGKAGRCYLLALTGFSRGLHHGTNATWFGGKWLDAIIEVQHWCLEGRTYTSVPSPDLPLDEQLSLRKLDYALFTNWLVAVAAESKFKEGRKPEVVHAILHDANVVHALKQFLEENKFLWQAAANGLELASTLGSSDEQMIYFYDRLKALDPGFISFDYTPGEIPAIAKEPGMKRFCERFRKELHRELPPR